MKFTTRKIYHLVALASSLFLFAQQRVFSQSVYQPYSYQSYQKLSSDLYSTNTRIHTTIKPWFSDDSLLKRSYDSLMNITSESGRIFRDHLFDVKVPGYTFYADVLPDAQVGYNFSGPKSTWLASLGYQIGGTIGSKFSYYGSGYNNRAQFPAFITNYANSTNLVPGQTRVTNRDPNITEWSYYTGSLSYTPVKYVNFTLGQDKTFIGDGYRSMLLSDYAAPYPFFKVTFNLGDVRYMAMYAMFEDPNGPKLANSSDNLTKWGYFQYLDWNISNRVSLGFFETLISADRDEQGHKRGFDFSYATPLIFLTTLESNHGSPDKNTLGFTGKWKIADKNIVYGQFVLGEFQAHDFFSSNGSSRNKYAWQVGVRGADIFSIKNLNYLFEFNTAKPYTYTETVGFRNYSQYDEPLAHPFGANFREWLGILNYSVGRFDLQGQLNYAYYGLDMNGLDYGQNIFEPYTSAVQVYGNYTGQGLRTDFYYAEGKIAYVLNPKYNLRIELGAMYRHEKNSQFDSKTSLITIGLRSSFRNIYNDF
jgi:hypothetical protein